MFADNKIEMQWMWHFFAEPPSELRKERDKFWINVPKEQTKFYYESAIGNSHTFFS